MATPATQTTSADEKSKEAQKEKLSGRTWKYMAKRVLAEFGRDAGTDQAAGLTYFMVLSLAPTLLAVFSLITLVLSDITDQLAALITEAVMRSGVASSMSDPETVVKSTLDSLMGSTGGGTIALIIGVATALWSASAYVKAYSRVSNQMYDVPEGRGFVKLNLTMLLVTLAIVISLVLVAISLLLSESIANSLLAPIAGPLGLTGLVSFLTESFLPIWAWVKWPVIVALLFVVVSLLYWAAPNLKKPFRLVSPGGIFAILGIGVAAVALAIYMSTFASYSSYGAIGSIMAILFALWVINIVIIMGAEVDAEYERAKELEAGRPAEDSLTIPLREEKGAEKKEAKYEKIVDEARDIRLSNLTRDQASYTGTGARLGADRDTGSSPAPATRTPVEELGNPTPTSSEIPPAEAVPNGELPDAHDPRRRKG
ncbi:YihY/virulence factor BrkB family protein [Brachybacterium sp. JHP9]|uniref:YihY/virulence factor BrkB family protein n=1 Tax=Brachybacterium equifaecis TaxID=2910770 RepID=A0ABT0R2C4_9MICO|nr:YihY/virulence factor BrkB family protein [Brachybacterium equifaecis]MCL6423920.1 YihY/virulence factor BrkB family protein [Brachybacterium equifaecis]